ncbi:LacI family DNA-binding transcriptional regulator [Pedomonas mirosovicensis]|uniref:LacI family DNA-binding transcriptional regulator n=1 Tax=Pedomonas mirosovicensis TaxID=2908641 RepID=UPI0021683EA6|nr:LacI family DNA-binding transcriptional regulator [Pedomonas mirosovicensis]MCH8686202.1 LacI family DNA-binding transcriptional regulator [Pedomonas mirosovicensis]
MEPRSSRRGRRTSTINDVARHAGVSPMTVSRVINGESNVRPETRELVEAAIRALNYAPNPAARSLASAGLIRIGLLYSNPSAAYLSEFLVGSLDQCRRHNIQLVVEKCEPETDEQAVAEQLIASGIDGLILPPPLCDEPEMLDLVIRTRTPAVAVAPGVPNPEVSAVSIDNFEAALTMTRHLIELGHRRIGFIIGHPNQGASARRLDGYRAALVEAGLAVDESLITQGYFTYRSGLDAAEQLLRLPTPPTAIFASNDDMAAASVAVVHRHGLDVPGDITVCGFDDTALATTIWPELTTIRQPVTEMSRAAVDLLLQEIRQLRAKEQVQPSHLLLDFELIRRQSDAIPRRPKAARKAAPRKG